MKMCCYSKNFYLLGQLVQALFQSKIELDEGQYIGKFKPFMVDVVFKWWQRIGDVQTNQTGRKGVPLEDSQKFDTFHAKIVLDSLVIDGDSQPDCWGRHWSWWLLSG